jgi:hypothetical protein
MPGGSQHPEAVDGIQIARSCLRSVGRFKDESEGAEIAPSVRGRQSHFPQTYGLRRIHAASRALNSLKLRRDLSVVIGVLDRSAPKEMRS